jgi:hypothetical protein
MRACMPIYVVDPPLWLYGAFAVIGALLAGGMTLGYGFARRAWGRRQPTSSGAGDVDSVDDREPRRGVPQGELGSREGR